MTLYDRLRPEYREKLDTDYEKYPSAIENLYQDLRELEYIINMRFNTFTTLFFYLDIRYPDVSPYDLFLDEKDVLIKELMQWDTESHTSPILDFLK